MKDKLIIKVGKTYRTNDGHKVEISLVDDDLGKYSYFGLLYWSSIDKNSPKSPIFYDVNGRCGQWRVLEYPSDYDIVGLWEEPVTLVEEKMNKPSELEVGKYYLTREYKIVYIYEQVQDGFYGRMHTKKGLTTRVVFFDNDGFATSNFSSVGEYDLIGICPDQKSAKKVWKKEQKKIQKIISNRLHPD